MKIYKYLAAAAFVILAAAAVVLGSLNQDEGWYLYAAKLVAEGKMLYRDFFFTQGPVMPVFYSFFSSIWDNYGIIGARVFTVLLGLLSLLFSSHLAYRLAPDKAKKIASLLVFVLLGSNLYHVYYLAIPKTYALSSLALSAGFYLFSFIDSKRASLCVFFAGSALVLAAATRITLVLIPVVLFLYLLFNKERRGILVFSFALGCGIMALLAYLPYVCDEATWQRFVLAHFYHASRGSFDLMLFIGSLSRIVRWYLPIWVLLGLSFAFPDFGTDKKSHLLLVSFAVVAFVQFLAPFPYDDYQVPIMPLIAVYTAVRISAVKFPVLLLALGMTWALSFGSPLLESFMTAGQDRFWVVRKDSPDVFALRRVAKEIERLDPDGKMLLTQDLYLAIETNRNVPEGFEMGPFSYWGEIENAPGLNDKKLLEYLRNPPCKVAALSGYTFAITAPSCVETPVKKQVKFFEEVKKNYKLVSKTPNFGQNSTSLMILSRKGDNGKE